MTLHPYQIYKCKKCGFNYIPILFTSRCPYCGAPIKQVFNDFIDLFFKSASYNLNRYGTFSNVFWFVLSVGDSYYLAGFELLEYFHTKYLIYSVEREDELPSKISFEDIMKVYRYKECISVSEILMKNAYNESKDEKQRALINHIDLFLKKVCEELNRRKNDG